MVLYIVYRYLYAKGVDLLLKKYKRYICALLIVCAVCLFAQACSGGESAESAEETESAASAVQTGSEPESSVSEEVSSGEEKPLPATEAEVKRYGEGETRSDPPVVAEYITAEECRGAVGGTCAEGAVVFAVLRGKVIAHANSSHGTFILELPLVQSASALDVQLYACEPGKQTSEAVNIKTSSSPTGEYPAPQVVWVGKNGWLFFNNTEKQFTNNETLSRSVKGRITTRTKQRVSSYSNRDIELIYVLIPNPNELYPQEMPDGIEQGSVSLREQAAEALAAGGATVIDMGPVLKAQLGNTEHELYHHTDSHWTEYSAYLAYREICKVFAQKFPSAAARDISEFGFTEEYREAGDLYYDLGLQKHLLRFRSTFSHITFETPVDRSKYAHGEATVINDDNMQYMEFHNAQSEGKPSFLMLRDSYSIMLFDWLAERAADSYYKPLWDFNIDVQEAFDLGVDYVIIFICDMNLNSVLR